MGANQSLSNLTSPTAINQELIFGTGIDGYISTKFEPAGTSTEMSLRTGDAVTTGNVSVRSGDGDSTGGVFITTGGAAVGASGNINLTTGTGAGSRGVINFDADVVNVLNEKEVRWYDAGSASYVGLKAPTVAVSHTLTLPAPSGITGALLSNDGFGNTSWVQLGGLGNLGDVLTNDGSGNLSWAPVSPTYAMANNQYLTGRDTGNTTDFNLIGVDGSNRSVVGNSTQGTRIEGAFIGLVAASGGVSIQSDTGLSLLGNGVTSPLLSIYDPTFLNSIDITVPLAVTGYSITLPAAQGTAGQTLENNGSGVLSWVTPAVVPAGVYFDVAKTTAQSIPSGAPTIIDTWDAPSVDTDSAFNTATGEYTVVTAGRYRISATASLAASGPVTSISVAEIHVNGAAIATNERLNSSLVNATHTITRQVNLAATDVVTVKLLQSTGGAVNTVALASYMNFCLEKV